MTFYDFSIYKKNCKTLKPVNVPVLWVVIWNLIGSILHPIFLNIVEDYFFSQTKSQESRIWPINNFKRFVINS